MSATNDDCKHPGTMWDGKGTAAVCPCGARFASTEWIGGPSPTADDWARNEIRRIVLECASKVEEAFEEGNPYARDAAADIRRLGDYDHFVAPLRAAIAARDAEHAAALAELEARVARLEEALALANETITDAINDYVTCRCKGVVPGDPNSHAGCSTGELLVAMLAARRALAHGGGE